MNRLMKYASVAFVCFMAVNAVLGASYWIYSPERTITPKGYSLTMDVDEDEPVQYQVITFFGQLTSTGGLPVDNQNVTLFQNDVAVAWNLTIALGNYIIHYNVTDLAPFKVKVGYWVQ